MERKLIKKTMSLMVTMLMIGLMLAGCGSQKTNLPKTGETPDWIARLGEEKGAEQIFVVAGIGQTTAYVSLHEKDASGTWKEIMTTPGYIGKFGLGKTKEGDGKTPIGEFRFNYAFGIADDPGCSIKYHKVTEDDYWSGDVRDGYGYNTMVSLKDYPDLAVDDSERIMDYELQYQYCLNISYNEDGIPGVGSAIFLHCLGPVKPYTGGCVAIPTDCMETVMQNVREDCVVVIDSLEVLSPETWDEFGLTGAAAKDAAADNTASQSTEAEEEAGQDTDSRMDEAENEDEYTSADGWIVHYRKGLFAVKELDEHTTSFVYQGESAGTNMVTISYVDDTQPEEAMSELTGNWEAEEDRTEGIFPGTEDKWGYWRTLKTSGDGSGYGETVIGGEYNGGALLFDIVSHKGDDEGQNAKISDYLGGIIDSIQYEDFAPQTMYAYYPGTYEQSGQDVDKTNRIVLNEDHTGRLSFENEADILWGSRELIAADGSFQYEYTIEGETLMLNYDGKWMEFTKSAQNNLR